MKTFTVSRKVVDKQEDLNSSAGQREREARPRRVRHSVEEGAAIPGENFVTFDLKIQTSESTRGVLQQQLSVFTRLQSIYKKNDVDNSGTMSTPEMRVAFKDAGQFSFSFFCCSAGRLVAVILQHVTFDLFTVCCLLCCMEISACLFSVCLLRLSPSEDSCLQRIGSACLHVDLRPV